VPETHQSQKKGTQTCKDPKRRKAHVPFNQKTVVLLARIQVLEKEDAGFISLLEKEKLLNIEKAQSLSTASHDCRSRLTSIQLSTSLIERYYDRLDKKRLFIHLDKIKFAVIELTGKLNELTEVNTIHTLLLFDGNHHKS